MTSKVSVSNSNSQLLTPKVRVFIRFCLLWSSKVEVFTLIHQLLTTKVRVSVPISPLLMSKVCYSGGGRPPCSLFVRFILMLPISLLHLLNLLLKKRREALLINNNEHRGYDAPCTILPQSPAPHAPIRGMSCQPSLYRANLVS